MYPAEPIAIVGMACRFAAGIDSPRAFWSLLRAGRDVVGELPDGRWDWYASRGRDHAAAVRGAPRRGAFLADIKGFDADFFGITPREAALMDPQQRIALELAWEALEHAGIPPADLAASDAGVFMGVGSDDYGRRLLEDLPRIEAWTGIGGAYCGVANRVSHLLDLRGPSLAVDTACSSSLVAIHLAAQALGAGECPVALAGGVLVMAAPGLSLVLDAAGATAPDGRCRSFDAAAGGYGRGEGGGVVVLKRLADARRDGDRVLAVLRGSAVHQDGRTNGIMAPNGVAQAHLLRRTYAAAGIDPASIGYVEAHGTGTRAGDPLEAGALASVFGADRPADRPLLIGSAKTNVGHLEAGAGVTGVIKTVLALRHGELPASLNLTTPNPAIPWDEAGIRVVRERTPWPDNGGPRRAGVSAYGYGGTLAHVILEAGDPAEQPVGDAGPALYPLSGASRAAVARYAGRLARRLREPDGPGTAGVGYTLARRRAHLPHRAVVFAADRAQLIGRLDALAGSPTAPPTPTAGADGAPTPTARSGGPAPRAGAPDGRPTRPAGASVTGTVCSGAGRGVVWVFSGHGSQWTGMGRELLATQPVFAEVIDRLDPVFQAEIGFGARYALLDDAPQPVDVIQPLIFAVQVALAATLRAHGVRPAAVIGHSVGEIAAAVTAGVFSLDQGARLVCRRSVLLRRVAGAGAMALVSIPPQEAERRLGARSGVDVAVTAARSVVISGTAAEVTELGDQWRAEGLDVYPVRSDVAFHSRQMDPLLDPLAAAVADLTPAAAEIPVYSTALADPRSRAARDGRYWATNLRQPVRFGAAVAAAVEDGYRLFLEVSPHPVATHSIGETLDDLGVTDAWVTYSAHRERPARETLLTGVGSLHCHGAEVDWSALWPDGMLTDLPTTAWQRRPHWAEEPPGRSFLSGQHDPASHTLLGGRINVYGSTPASAWLTYLDRASRPYPGDHPVRGVEIMPAAVLLNTFLTAAAGDGPLPELTDVALRVPVSAERPRYLQVVLQDGTIRLSSRIADEQDDEWGWVTHTTAEVRPPRPPHGDSTDDSAPGATLSDDTAPAGTTLGGTGPTAEWATLPPGHVIDRLAQLGVAAMGFPWAVAWIRQAPGALRAEVRAAEPATGNGDGPRATWAAALDAALSVASVAFPGPPVLRMPAHIAGVALAAVPPPRVGIAVRVTGPDTVDVAITEAGATGELVGTLRGLRFGVLEGDTGAVSSPRALVHQVVWRPVPVGHPSGTGRVVLVGPPSPLRKRLVERLGTAAYRVVAGPAELRDPDLTANGAVLVVPDLGPPDAVARTAERASWLLASTARRLAEAGTAQGARLWCVTQGVRDCADPRALGHAPLWGLGRVIGGEHPEFWAGVIDIGPAPEDLDGLLATLAGATVTTGAGSGSGAAGATGPGVTAGVTGAGGGWTAGEDVIAVRDGRPAVARLVHPAGPPVRAPAACRPDGTYLVTGGLGALGLEVARWLADRGARRIVLASRTGLPPRDTWDRLAEPAAARRVAAVRALERLGVTVAAVALDVADPDAARRLLTPTALGLPPVCGVVHAAGVLDNRTLGRLDEDSLRTVLRPKVAGALVLHTLFPPGSLDFFALFSSCGHLLGLPGQASYAAGNAFLDALAVHRRTAGDRATISLGWTSWRGLGMSTSSAAIDAELAARGTGDISAAEAFASWELAERYGLEHAAVLRTIGGVPTEHLPPLLRELPTTAPPPAPPAAEAPWAGLSGTELHAALTGEIRRAVAGITKLAAVEVDPRRPLVELGLDSVMTVRLRRHLERQFQVPLPATLLWDRPTAEAVATLVAGQIAAPAPDGDPTGTPGRGVDDRVAAERGRS